MIEPGTYTLDLASLARGFVMHLDLVVASLTVTTPCVTNSKAERFAMYYGISLCRVLIIGTEKGIQH